MRAAIGFSVHTGWAAAVVLTDAPSVLARFRIDLATTEHDARFVYHAAAERGRAAERIRKAAALARGHAEAALRAAIAAHAVGVAALPASKRVLPELATILASHPLLHAAEGELYRLAIAEACAALGLLVVTPRAVAPLVQPGPPWAKDQRDAAALAWGALGDSLPGSPSANPPHRSVEDRTQRHRGFAAPMRRRAREPRPQRVLEGSQFAGAVDEGAEQAKRGDFAGSADVAAILRPRRRK
jgi:hypothetical protein